MGGPGNGPVEGPAPRPGPSQFYALEAAGIDAVLVNAAHIKNVPGRNTDTADAAWICQLAEHGLLRASFIPPPGLRALHK